MGGRCPVPIATSWRPYRPDAIRARRRRRAPPGGGGRLTTARWTSRRTAICSRQGGRWRTNHCRRSASVRSEFADRTAGCPTQMADVDALLRIDQRRPTDKGRKVNARTPYTRGAELAQQCIGCVVCDSDVGQMIERSRVRLPILHRDFSPARARALSDR